MVRRSARAWAWPRSHPHRRGARPAQHDIQPVPERDALDAVLEVEARDQQPAAGLGDAVEDRIDGEQRIAREEHLRDEPLGVGVAEERQDRKSTRLNSSHGYISYAVFCLKKKKYTNSEIRRPY